MEPTIFQAHPEIIEKMFDTLDAPTLLNCRLVCKSWNIFLETPSFWLKKLREIGHPIEFETSWKTLIAKSIDFKIEKCVFAKCLRMKYQNFLNRQEKGLCDKHILLHMLKKFPPLYSAACFGSIEIVKLIYHLGEDYNRRIDLNDGEVDFVMPIFTAIANGHTEIAKFLLETPQEKENPSVDCEGYTPLQLAIFAKNFDIVKFLVPKTPNLNYQGELGSEPSLLHLAVQDYGILKYLMSQPGIDPNLKCHQKTALQILSNYKLTSIMEIPPGDIAKMIQILAPFADKEDLYSGYGNSPLHIAAKTGNVEALEALLEFFDVNKKDRFGLPLDAAITNLHIECVKILAPLTTELKIDEKFSMSSKKMIKISNVLQYVINERQRTSKRKIDENSDKNAIKKSKAMPN